jgi:protein-tyrosine-phosphatase
VPAAPFTVLFVCTGNICRSALAERWGRARLADVHGEAAEAVRLTSAGIRAVVGSGMNPLSADVLRDLGGDPAGFVARQLTDEQIRSADLVLTMTRAQRQEVLAGAPRALARTFTLREAADLLVLLGDVELPGGSVAEPAAALVAAMARSRSRRATGHAEDIADPFGRPFEAHREAGAAITQALGPVLERLARSALGEPGALPVHPKV